MRILFFSTFLFFVIISHCKDIRNVKFFATQEGQTSKQHAEGDLPIKKIRDTENFDDTSFIPAELISERDKRCSGRLGFPLSSRLGSQKTDLPEEISKKGRKLYETLCKACIKKNNCQSLDDCPLCGKWCVQAASICDNETNLKVDPGKDDTTMAELVSSRGNFEDNSNTYTVTMTNGTLMEIILNLLSIKDTKSIECVTITVKGVRNQQIQVDSDAWDDTAKQDILSDINERKFAMLNLKNKASLEPAVVGGISKEATLRDSEVENIVPQIINPDIIEESPDMSSILGHEENSENQQVFNRNSGMVETEFVHQDQPQNQLFSGSLQNHQPNVVGATNPIPEDEESMRQSSAAFSTLNNVKTVELKPELRENPIPTDNVPLQDMEQFMRAPNLHHHHHHHHGCLSRSDSPSNELPTTIGTLGSERRSFTNPQQQFSPVFNNRQPFDNNFEFPPFFQPFFGRSNVPINSGYELDEAKHLAQGSSVQIENLTPKTHEMAFLPEAVNSQVVPETRDHHHHHHHHHWHSSSFRANENDEESGNNLKQTDDIVEPSTLYPNSHLNDLSVQSEAKQFHNQWDPSNSRLTNNRAGISHEDGSFLESPAEQSETMNVEKPTEQQFLLPSQFRLSDSVEKPIPISPESEKQLVQSDGTNVELQNEGPVEDTNTSQRKIKLGARANELMKKIRDRQDQKLAKLAKVRENIVGQRKSTDESVKEDLGDTNVGEAQNLDQTEVTLQSRQQQPVEDPLDLAQLALANLEEVTNHNNPDVSILGSQPLDNSWESNLKTDSLHFVKPKPEETLKAVNEIDEAPGISIRGQLKQNEMGLGKLIPSSRNMQISYKGPSDIYFIGNGIKLPLRMETEPDGTLALSVDVEKLCSCQNISCPKDHSTIERTVGKILEKNAELQEQLEDTLGMVPEDSAGNSFTNLKNRMANNFDYDEVTRKRRSAENILIDNKDKIQQFLKEMLGKSVEEIKNKLTLTLPSKKVEENVIPVNKLYKFKYMEDQLANNIEKTVDNYSKLDDALLENESDILRNINEDPLVREEVGFISDLLGFFKTLTVDNNNSDNL